MKHRVAGAPLDFAALRAELEVPGDFASGVLVEANRAVESAAMPDEDATGIPFVTLDPVGSRDLDQALHIDHHGDGYLVSYAIVDIAAFVRPGGLLDAETHRRGATLYFPDERVPLHPTVLSESAASLLPGQVRPAVLWQIALAADGTVTSTELRRARVRSTAQLDYPAMQTAYERGALPGAIAALPHVGRARMALARKRHAIDLDLPEELVERTGDEYSLTLRTELPVERFNAEISLLTGMCAATIMLAGGVGILRTVPPPSEGAVQALRRTAYALGIHWQHDVEPGDLLNSIDRTDPRHFAFVEHAASLLRGASYTAFDGSPPQQTQHSGIGAPYAHVTAPLRRLVDRYATEICLSLQAGAPVPDWVRSGLGAVPDEMQRADHLEHEVDRAVVDTTEAWLLQSRVGEVFDAVVIEAEDHAGTILLDGPPVRARCAGAGMRPGDRVRARLLTADVQRRDVQFERAD